MLTAPIVEQRQFRSANEQKVNRTTIAATTKRVSAMAMVDVRYVEMQDARRWFIC
jgi:hypothetical protein